MERAGGGRARGAAESEVRMGFSILGALAGAAGGALAGVVGGGFTGGNPIGSTGSIDNGLLSGWESNVLAQQDLMNEQMAYFQLGVQKQANQFNMMTDEKSELQREQNALREVAMEQRKADISITREFIRSIG